MRADGHGSDVGTRIRWRALVCGMVVWHVMTSALAQSVGIGVVRGDVRSSGARVDIPCLNWHCADSPWLRLQLRRELRAQALRDARDGASLRPDGRAPLYATPRYVPPPTPEAQVQPRYRGSGEVRPEYLDTEAARE